MAEWLMLAAMVSFGIVGALYVLTFRHREARGRMNFAIRLIALFGAILAFLNFGACVGVMVILTMGSEATETVLASVLAVVMTLAAIVAVAQFLDWLAGHQVD